MAENTKPINEPEEEMGVELELDDGKKVMCDVVTIIEVAGLDYIALAPRNSDPLGEQEVWFYRYSENPDDPNAEPVLDYISDDDEYELVMDAFEEYLDSQYYDSLED